VAGHDGTKLTVAGDLTIKDVTRPVELTAEFEGVTTSPAAAGGKQVIGFLITGEIDREDWGITYNIVLEAGGFMVSKTIGIENRGRGNPPGLRAASARCPNGRVALDPQAGACLREPGAAAGAGGDCARRLLMTARLREGRRRARGRASSSG
jgi:hypothetical protein